MSRSIIHLTISSLLGNEVTMIVHDTSMEEVATRLGLDVRDPLDSSELG